MKPYYKYIVIALLVLLVTLAIRECGRIIEPEEDYVFKHAPSATPMNNWLRKDLNAIADTTEHYKQESAVNKPKVAKNRKVLHNTLKQIIVDTSKVDSLYEFAKDADKQMKIDSAVKANQEKQIEKWKDIDSNNQVIKDSADTDSKKVIENIQSEAKKDNKKARSTGRYQGVIITVGVAILVKIGLSLIK